MGSTTESDHGEFIGADGVHGSYMVVSDLDVRNKENDHVGVVLYDANKQPYIVRLQSDDAMALAVSIFKHAARVAGRPWPIPSEES